MLKDELRLTAYAPAMTLRRRSKGKDNDIRKPLIQGYCFIDCAEADFARIHATRLVTGFVKRHLPSGETAPAPLPPIGQIRLAQWVAESENGDYDIDETKGLPTLKVAKPANRKDRRKDRRARRVNALALIGELIASATAEATEMAEAA